jgi:radical S-adenosyl methionine domain-containing protein 2
MHVKQLGRMEAFAVIEKLYNAGLKKITFAGGEPMMYRHLDACIRYSKTLGLTTSIITNGSCITDSWLSIMRPYLDWVGVSIDSLNPTTHTKIGRTSDKVINYRELIDSINGAGYRLKINTVVNAYNKDEDMNEFISWANPDRWKVFQALRIEGQNDKQFDEIKVSDNDYIRFLTKHSHQLSLVPESNELMTGSYLLIDPQGRLFENSKGAHTYSSPLQDNDIEKCLSEINLNREMFIKRGGIYQW